MKPNIDWLSVSFWGEIVIPPKFSIVVKDMKTRHFNIVEEIFYSSKRVFTIVRSPASRALNPDLCICKWDNWLLYDNQIFSMFKALTSNSHITNIKVSRIDICIDFPEFYNNLQCQSFIRQFLRNKYIKNNVSHYKLESAQINDDGFVQNFDWISFGHNTSSIKTYIYNKTLEMKQVKFKQWIYDSWKINELPVDRDIYRLEFAIHPGQFKICSTSNGAILNIDYFAVQQYEFIQMIFESLVYKYFDFRINDGQKNKCRMKRVNLFKLDSPPFIFLFDSDNTDTNRSDKIFINKSLRTFSELREVDSARSEHYLNIADIHATTTNLQQYFQYKKMTIN